MGVTLPLISYGGSSMLTIMIALGLVMNVSVRRFAY
jgi:rod shape determining protein RodA